MILKGNERGYGLELARHLLNPRDNDHVTVHRRQLVVEIGDLKRKLKASVHALAIRHRRRRLYLMAHGVAAMAISVPRIVRSLPPCGWPLANAPP